MLFILSNTEDGLRCEQVEPDKFDLWVNEQMDGVRPEYHPRFVNEMPNESSDTSEYFVIEGRVIVPQPVTTVTSYMLPEK